MTNSFVLEWIKKKIKDKEKENQLSVCLAAVLYQLSTYERTVKGGRGQVKDLTN